MPIEQRPKLKDILGTRILIKWEEQLVDPKIAYITSVNIYNFLYKQAILNVQ